MSAVRDAAESVWQDAILPTLCDYVRIPAVSAAYDRSWRENGHIDRAVEGVGGRSNAVTSFDYTTFYIIVPSEGIDTALGLLADMAHAGRMAQLVEQQQVQRVGGKVLVHQNAPPITVPSTAARSMV